MAAELSERLLQALRTWGHDQWREGRRQGQEESRTPEDFSYAELREETLALITEASTPCHQWFRGPCHDRCGRAVRLLRHLDPRWWQNLQDMRESVRKSS